MKSWIMLATFIATACLGGASTITIDVTRDLLTMPKGSLLLPGGPTTLSNGDHVVHTVDFADNQALTISDGLEFMLLFLFCQGNTSNYTITNTVVELLGATSSGGAASVYLMGTQSGGSANIGVEFYDFLSPGQSITFTGYRSTYDILSISGSPQEYQRDFFYFDGREVSIGTAPLPETGSTLWLAAGAVAALAGGRWKAKRHVA